MSSIPSRQTINAENSEAWSFGTNGRRRDQGI